MKSSIFIDNPPGDNFSNILQAAFLYKSVLTISPTFYEQLFHMKGFFKAFMCLQLEFVIFWQKKIDRKAAHKMLVKLITVDRYCSTK